MWDMTNYLILPRFSTIKFYLSSFDVIHSFGINSFGVKLDVIPAQINLGATLRLLVPGEARGYCYELCGQGHSNMILNSIII
jgi:cytochrome c oxidase subunit 2